MFHRVLLLTVFCSVWMAPAAFSTGGGDHPFPKQPYYGEHPFPLGEHPFPLVVAAQVEQVIDGDTLLVSINQRTTQVFVDLAGVEAMELNFQGRRQGDGAIRARERLMSFFRGAREVVMGFEEENPRKGSTATGKEGFYQAHIYRWENRANKWISANELMLYTGWAVAKVNYPYVMTAMDYLKLTRDAMQHERGMFSEDYWTGYLPFEFRLSQLRMPPTEWVGDILSRRVAEPSLYKVIPPFRRIFFKSLQQAEAAGYRHSSTLRP